MATGTLATLSLASKTCPKAPAPSFLPMTKRPSASDFGMPLLSLLAERNSATPVDDIDMEVATLLLTAVKLRFTSDRRLLCLSDLLLHRSIAAACPPGPAGPGPGPLSPTPISTLLSTCVCYAEGEGEGRKFEMFEKTVGLCSGQGWDGGEREEVA
eukprot:Rhum_TRINITY_DN2414_c0_g1::Rhum_TRINITY_DN2414_c0_g1_i1::g.7144::m.7144